MNKRSVTFEYIYNKKSVATRVRSGNTKNNRFNMQVVPNNTYDEKVMNVKSR